MFKRGVQLSIFQHPTRWSSTMLLIIIACSQILTLSNVATAVGTTPRGETPSGRDCIHKETMPPSASARPLPMIHRSTAARTPKRTPRFIFRVATVLMCLLQVELYLERGLDLVAQNCGCLQAHGCLVQSQHAKVFNVRQRQAFLFCRCRIFEVQTNVLKRKL